MEGVNLTIILVSLLILFSSMDFKHKIIQWNCPGLKPNFNEVSLLISEYNPSVFCFQETFLKPDDNISLKGFNIYNYVHTDCLRPSGGASVFVKVSNGAKIRNRYNQAPHLTQDTNGKVTNSQKTPQTRAKRSALSQQVTTKHI